MTGTATTSFVGAPAQREQRFYALAEGEGLDGEGATALWRAAGAGNADGLTGFAGPGDRAPTVEGAIKHVTNGGAACYVEVDIRNVGGLNKVSKTLGDEMVRDIAGAARAAVASVGGDVTAVRHGGDEVSFIVVADGDSQSLRQRLVDALEAAKVQVRGDVAHLDWVPHPKRHGEGGTGLFFGVAAVTPGSDPDQVMHEADSAVETMKNA
jgi:GGDEF domain-containing protein